MLAFWLYRLVAQLFVYDSELWRHRPAHLVVHVVFSVLWLAISAVLGWALVVQLSLVADV
jgi:hypothetical protein